MKYILSLLFLLFISPVNAKMTKIAVIDTGINNSDKISMCQSGHLNLTSDRSLIDNIGHGNHVSLTIHKNAKDASYCQIIIKYYTKSGANNLINTVKAFNHAIDLNVDIINYSSGGLVPNLQEKEAIRKALNNKIVVNVASGNERLNLDHSCNFYPACYYTEINVIGNTKTHKGKNTTTNYGNIVDHVIDGNDILAGGYVMSGSSVSTAIYSGRYIYEVNNGKRYKEQDAYRETARALSRTRTARKYVKNLEKFIPDGVLEFFNYATPISRVIINKKVEYKWEFE